MYRLVTNIEEGPCFQPGEGQWYKPRHRAKNGRAEPEPARCNENNLGGVLPVCCALPALSHSLLSALRVEERVQNTLACWPRSQLDQIQNLTLPEAAQVESTGWSHAVGLILALSVINCVTLGKLFNLSLNFLMSQMRMA